jgi:hypothetical protein
MDVLGLMARNGVLLDISGVCVEMCYCRVQKSKGARGMLEIELCIVAKWFVRRQEMPVSRHLLSSGVG